MTVKVNDRRREYDGDGIATTFNGPMAYRASDLQVYLVDPLTNIATLQVANYTVNAIGRTNGTRVVMNVAPPVGLELLILRTVPFAQEVDITNQGSFNAEAVEQGDDLLGMQIQQLADVQSRSLQVPDTFTGAFSTLLPFPEELTLIGWDQGQPFHLRNFRPEELVTMAAFSDFRVELFTGTGGQTQITLTEAPGPIANLTVTIDGLVQVPVLDYTLSGNLVTLGNPLLDGQEVLARYGQALPSGVQEAASVLYTAPFAGAVTRSGASKWAETISVKDAGAVGDGVTDDWPAVKAAWAYAAAFGKRLYIPAGTYNLLSMDTHLEPSSGMVVHGDGMGVSVIKFNKAVAQNLIYRPPNLARLSDIEFRDFAIDGSHGDGGNYTQVNSYPILLYKVDRIQIRRVKITRSRVMGMALRECEGVDVDGCVVQYAARDGISTTSCMSVKVNNNRVEFCDDDAISNHTDKLSPVMDQDFVCTGNIVRFSQGIKCLGGRSFTITGNVIEFFMANGISVETQSVSTKDEGVTSGGSGTITGNVLRNGIDRSAVDGLSTGAPYIEIGGVSAQLGGLAALPGENNAAGGTIIALYPYLRNIANNVTTAPVPPSYNYTITGNTFVRDIPNSGLLSALGYGIFYTRNGPVDVTLNDAAIREDGIVCVDGIIKNVIVQGNTFMGIRNAVFVASASRMVNTIIAQNTFFDVTSALAFDAANTEKHTINFDDNIVDIDPLFTSSNRGAGGTWLADGNPTAIILQSARGLTMRRNTFKNTCRICDQSVHSTANLSGTFFFLQDNVVEGVPNTVGAFNVANIGIGSAPRGGLGFNWRIVDGNPSSATYGQVLNYCPLALPALPSSGTYAAGHFIRNTNATVAGAASSQYMVQGWFRATTGSAHVLNTDWREMRTLTGT